MGADHPGLKLHIGERSLDPVGAFYPIGRGLRWSVVYPWRNLTFRLEGGEDSEFGYLAIAGLQWAHPRLPLVAGVGVPVNMKDANGEVGVVVQFRMRLD